MVDVGSKADTKRIAVASGVIRMNPETVELIRSGSAQKGDVLGVAQVAGIMEQRQDWRRDGSVDSRKRGRTDDLRHGESSG